MKYTPDSDTNEGWGGMGNATGYNPSDASGQYTAGSYTGPPPLLQRRKHGAKRYAPGATASVVGPYSTSQTVERVT